MSVAFLTSDCEACYLGRQLVGRAQLLNLMLGLFFCWGAHFLWLLAARWPIAWLGAFLLRDLDHIALANSFLTLSALFDCFRIVISVVWVSNIVVLIGLVDNCLSCVSRKNGFFAFRRWIADLLCWLDSVGIKRLVATWTGLFVRTYIFFAALSGWRVVVA